MIVEAIVTLTLLGLVFGALLAYASKKFHVKVDEREHKVEEALPGLNCGACGLAGCSQFAHSLVTGEIAATGCTAGGKKTAEKLGEIMGVEIEAKEPMVAKVFCGASTLDSPHKFSYQGLQNCRAAEIVAGGGKACSYGCMGYGSCAKICPVGAIKMEHKLPVVDEEKCVACAKCVKECPKMIIHLVPKSKKIHVLCSSKDSAPDVMKKCKTGCIACKLCETNCPVKPNKAVTVDENLASMHYDKCIQCGICATKCPRKTISNEK